jgi:hypothetical protein
VYYGTYATKKRFVQDAWKSSDFLLSEEELVARIPGVLDTLSVDDLAPPRSKKAKKSRI